MRLGVAGGPGAEPPGRGAAAARVAGSPEAAARVAGGLSFLLLLPLSCLCCYFTDDSVLLIHSEKAAMGNSSLLDKNRCAAALGPAWQHRATSL